MPYREGLFRNEMRGQKEERERVFTVSHLCYFPIKPPVMGLYETQVNLNRNTSWKAFLIFL